MATTIASSDLTTRVTESITLNGTVFDTVTTYTITGVNNYVNNVFSVRTGTQRILTFSRSGTPPAGSQYDIDDLKYLRITNSDDTTEVKITVNYLTSGAQIINVPPQGSYVMTDFALGAGDTVDNIDITVSADVDLPYVLGLVQ